MQSLLSLLSDKVSYRIILLLCGAAVIGWLAWIARDDFVMVARNIRPGYFLVAVLLGIMFTITQSALFAQLVAKHRSKANMRDLAAAFLLSQPGKYIPGKIWTAVMQSLALRDSINFAGIAIANVELVVIAMTQMATLGLACLWLDSPFMALTTMACGFVLSTMVIILPTTALLNRISSRVVTLLGINPSERELHLNIFWSAALLNGGAIICNFAASLWVLFAVGPFISHLDYGPILSSLYLAFAASLLVVPIPAGIGVREAATIGVGSLIAPQIPSTVLISVALLARCWQLLVDAACLGLGATMLAISPTAKK